MDDAKGESVAVFEQRKTLGKKPVKELAVVAALRSLFVLFDGVLQSYDLQSVTKSQLASIQNVETFCVDPRPPGRLCVALKGKKRLQLYRFDDQALKFSPVGNNEFVVPEVPLSMAFVGDCVCCGFSKTYSLVPLESDDERPVSLERKNGEAACIGEINENELLLLSSAGKDTLGMFTHSSGHAAPNRHIIMFSAPPAALACAPDMIIAALPTCIEVHSVLLGKVVQTIDFKGGSMVANSLSNRAAVASATEIMALRPMPVARQAKKFLDNFLVEAAREAMRKAYGPETDEWAEFCCEAGVVLLRDLRFPEAMASFTEGKIDPRDLIFLFPQARLRGVREPRNPHIRAAGQIGDLVQEGYDRKTRSEKQEDKHIVSAGPEHLRLSAHVAMAEYLWHYRDSELARERADAEVDAAVDTALLVILGNIGEMADKLRTQSQGQNMPEQSRQARQNILESANSLAHILESLIAKDNHCDTEPCAEFLGLKKRQDLAAKLYRSKRDYLKALFVLKAMGASDGSGAGAGADSREFGVSETVSLLQTVEDDGLLTFRSYLAWVLQADPARALTVFTASKRSRPLEPHRVLQLLRDMPSSRANIDLVIEAYLEHVIFTEKSKDRKLHGELADLHLSKVRRLMGSAASAASRGSAGSAESGPRARAGEEPGQLGSARKKLLHFLRESREYNAEALLRQVEDSDMYEEQIILNSKLGRHHVVLRLFVFKLRDFEAAARYCNEYPDSEDFEQSRLQAGGGAAESAAEVVPSRPSQLLSARLASGSTLAAAAGVSSSKQSRPKVEIAKQFEREKQRSDLFLQLLKIYFSRDPNLSASSASYDRPHMVSDFEQRGIDILSRFGFVIDPVEALKLVPPDLPISLLGNYLELTIPHMIHERRDKQVVKNLSKLENLLVSCDLIEQQSRMVRIEQQTICEHCGSRIGDANTIFMVMPGSKRPIHRKCYQQIVAAQQQQQQQRKSSQAQAPAPPSAAGDALVRTSASSRFATPPSATALAGASGSPSPSLAPAAVLAGRPR